MPRPTSYEIPDKELVDKLISVAAAAGTACSGLVVDMTTPSRVENLHYLKGCMLARLDGVKPEIQPGHEVEIPEGKKVNGKGLDGLCFGVEPLGCDNYTVIRVWYRDKQWFLELNGKSKEEGGVALYPADQFITRGKIRE